ncbi:MAG: winged helix-turn-helix transcriptional regulator [Clostridia bacterium]|nr:winged helix-turn-helix transcriptional regulator [Clostridia bacterium]
MEKQTHWNWLDRRSFWTDGEIIFFAEDDCLREMLRVLCGVSGESAEGVQPRMYLCESDSEIAFRAALDAAAERIPVLFIGAVPPVRMLPGGLLYRCLTRPFRYEDLFAAIDALSEGTRADVLPVSEKPAETLYWDEAASEAVCGEKRVRLSLREGEMYRMLLAASPECVQRDVLGAGFARDASNAVDVYVGYLRRKLCDFPVLIQSVRGRGYVLYFR